MKRYNVIAVFSSDMKKTLMCKRTKEPYKGLYNFVGGKVECDNSISEAYRELFEETGIKQDDIEIIHLMDMLYYRLDMELEIYYGVLKRDVTLVEEINKLEWISMEEDFFNYNKFAGDGNIGHIMIVIKNDINSVNKLKKVL